MPAYIEQEQPLVSVIIPNYNHARYVADAIRSVLAQEYRRYEIIVVDDGSVDDSREVIGAFGDQVVPIYQPNSGLSAARNTGVRAARGSLIGVLDADDMYEPDYLGTLISTLLKNPHADGIYCGYRFVDDSNNPLPQVEVRCHSQDRLYEALLDGNFLVPESVLLYRRVYEEVGLFNETLRACEDWDVWLRAARLYKIIHSCKILTRHRTLPGSMSTDPLRMKDNRLAVLKIHLGNEPAGRGNSIAHRAYGRAYLGSSVEYLQYGDRAAALDCLRRLYRVCPGLLDELDTFYQLGCYDQPKGSLGDLKTIDIKRNSGYLIPMIRDLFDSLDAEKRRKSEESRAFAAAFFALGVLAYGTRDFREARRLFQQALDSNPRLLLDRRLVTKWLKSWLPAHLIERLKSWRRNYMTV